MARLFLKLSRVSVLHYYKLVFRALLLIGVLLIYIFNYSKTIYETVEEFSIGGVRIGPFVLWGIWAIFVVEMLLRFFPSKFESNGCQKQFRRNYKPTQEMEACVAEGKKVKLTTWKGTLISALAWLALNSVFYALYFTGVFDQNIMLLIGLFYAVADMICILFFCPFQTWFMKNKCCATCRIYNWDFAMMCTPLVVIRHPFAWSLAGLSLLLLLIWEILVRVHPERFSEKTNAYLRCANCKEKLCQHKKQLRAFLKARSLLDVKDALFVRDEVPQDIVAELAASDSEAELGETSEENEK